MFEKGEKVALSKDYRFLFNEEPKCLSEGAQGVVVDVQPTLEGTVAWVTFENFELSEIPVPFKVLTTGE